ncbi:MAG TPA: GNAT family N-acetyltransferase [Steroidobacteraceae bacterium]|nr:GNAT family N-acetyltransferase [Steroidobacteraceae bacterium]
MGNTDGYSIEVLRDGRAIDALAREWKELPQSQANPLLAPEWFAAAAHTFGMPTETLALRRGGALAAVAPLGTDLRAGVARLQPLGVRALHEPSGLLYRDAQALEHLCEALIDRRRPFILQRMPFADALRPALARAARRRGVLYEIAAPAAPAVTFAGDGDVAAFEARLSSRRRHDFRRARRGLERAGQVTFDLRTPSVTSVAAELEEAMVIEASSWKARGGSTLLRTGRLRTFFHDYARRMAANGQLRIAFLRVDGTGIAMQLIIEHASRYWIYKVGYDEKWSEHSPGVQLMWEVMRHACGSRVAGVELLGKVEKWLTIWSREVREYRTLVYYPFNLLGVAAVAADAAHALAQKLKKDRSADSTDPD